MAPSTSRPDQTSSDDGERPNVSRTGLDEPAAEGESGRETSPVGRVVKEGDDKQTDSGRPGPSGQETDEGTTSRWREGRIEMA